MAVSLSKTSCGLLGTCASRVVRSSAAGKAMTVSIYDQTAVSVFILNSSA